MRWRNRRRSRYVEDRRGMRGGVRRRPGVRLSGGAIVVVLLAGLLLGEDPVRLLGLIAGGVPAPQEQAPPAPKSARDDDEAEFVSVVLADTEDTWAAIFPGIGMRYQPARLVMFSDAVESACGLNSSATGPFYCPPDRKVYIDLGFFEELKRLGAPGDFARAYVIGHEIGHHVQNLIGTSGRVQQARQRVGRGEANALSVRLELQADCYAGVWAYHANRDRKLLEPGDLEEGLQAAASIGDDRLQQRVGRRVRPESFTHGSSAQRVKWFRRGFEHGDLRRCDTFGAETATAPR